MCPIVPMTSNPPPIPASPPESVIANMIEPPAHIPA